MVERAPQRHSLFHGVQFNSKKAGFPITPVMTEKRAWILHRLQDDGTRTPF